jgi:hypothetical protein
MLLSDLVLHVHALSLSPPPPPDSRTGSTVDDAGGGGGSQHPLTRLAVPSVFSIPPGAQLVLANVAFMLPDCSAWALAVHDLCGAWSYSLDSEMHADGALFTRRLVAGNGALLLTNDPLGAMGWYAVTALAETITHAVLDEDRSTAERRAWRWAETFSRRLSLATDFLHRQRLARPTLLVTSCICFSCRSWAALSVIQPAPRGGGCHAGLPRRGALPGLGLGPSPAAPALLGRPGVQDLQDVDFAQSRRQIQLPEGVDVLREEAASLLSEVPAETQLGLQ